MARIRTLKPEFWSDEKLSLLDPVTRLVYLGCISMADDAGRLVDNVKAIDGMLFPNTDDSSEEALETLARLSRVLRYVGPSGQHLIQIIAWSRHQLVAHPSKYVLPAPTAEDYAQVQDSQQVNNSLAQVSRGLHESRMRASRDAHASTMDHGPRTKDLTTTARTEPRGMSEDERMVVSHYLTKFPRRRVDDKTLKRYIRPALKAFTPMELTQAIDGNANDPWHIERKKHELSYVLRDVEHISQFIAKAEPQGDELVGIGGDDTSVLAALGVSR